MKQNFIPFLYVPPSEASRPRCCSNSRSSGDGPGPDHNDYKKKIIGDEIQLFFKIVLYYTC